MAENVLFQQANSRRIIGFSVRRNCNAFNFMKLRRQWSCFARPSGRRGFTLTEVVVAIFICALVFAGIVSAYTQTSSRAQWSGYSLAAQALAMQQLEQARSGIWDPTSGRNELTNLALSGRTVSGGVVRGYSTSIMDLPISGTNVVWATNWVTVQTVSLNNTTSPPVQVQMLRVDTVWPFKAFGQNRLYTNTLATYLAPDDR
jgi:prepilin-type N-terminal cleavage/methylation domain-containing protein